jgi:hypothetical protein
VGVGGATLVDVAPWGAEDAVYEVVPVVGGGWLDVDAFVIEDAALFFAYGHFYQMPALGTAFNDADVTFAQGMIPHHQQAIEMADIALDPATGASAQVRDLATRIKAGQDPEIQLMTGWLAAWGQPAQETSSKN